MSSRPKRTRDVEVDLTDPCLCARDETGPEGPTDSSFMTWEDVAFETEGLVDGIPFVDDRDALRLSTNPDTKGLAEMAEWYERAERELVEQGKLLPIRLVEPDPAMERACRFAVPRALERVGFRVDPLSERFHVSTTNAHSSSSSSSSSSTAVSDDATMNVAVDASSGWIRNIVCSCATLKEWSSPDVRVAEWATVKGAVARAFPSYASEMLQRLREECEEHPRREWDDCVIHLGYHQDQKRIGLRLSVDRGDGRRRIVWGFRVVFHAP